MGRQGVNYLGKLDQEDLIATDEDSYVAAAVQLARDSERLQRLRKDLRANVTAVLFDPQSHVAELETAYAEMWRRQKEAADEIRKIQGIFSGDELRSLQIETGKMGAD